MMRAAERLGRVAEHGRGQHGARGSAHLRGGHQLGKMQLHYGAAG